MTPVRFDIVEQRHLNPVQTTGPTDGKRSLAGLTYR